MKVIQPVAQPGNDQPFPLCPKSWVTGHYNDVTQTLKESMQSLINADVLAIWIGLKE